MLLRLLSADQLQSGGCGLVCGAHRHSRWRELLARCHRLGPGGHGEGLRRSRDDAAGAKPGAYLVNQDAVNVGTARVAVHGVRADQVRAGG